MKTKLFLRCLITALIVSSCSHEPVMTMSEEQESDGVVEESPYVSGEAYIYFSEEMAELIEDDLSEGHVRTKSADLNAVMESLGISRIKRLFPHAGEFEERTRREGLHRWYEVEYSPTVPQTKAETDFLSVAGVEYFEQVRKIRIQDFDDLNSKLWGLKNLSAPGMDINVLPVWNNYTVGNADVIVSVVDGGVDVEHEDLAWNCLTAGHYNTVNDNEYITPDAHGTHVAGTIAAVSNNGKGVAGIAGGDYAEGRSGVKILSCQVFQDNPDGTTMSGNTAAAIKWGADHGAVISQNSWGYTYDYDGDGKLTGEELEEARNAKVSQADKQAIDYFIKYAGCDNDGNQLPDSPMKGGVVIFAAGNDALDNGVPASYSEVVAVGAISSEGVRTYFSNYGDWVDIAAPGQDIYSTLPGNSYGFMSGTSMACPHVTGVAALLVSHFGGTGFTNEMLKEKLIGGANTQILSSAYLIGGLLDTYGSFVYGKEVEVMPVTDLSAEGVSNQIRLSWTVPADSEGEPAYGFLIHYGPDKEAVEKATPDTHDGAEILTVTPGKPVGETVSVTIPGLEFESGYHIKVTAYSYGRYFSEASETASAVTEANNAPIVTVDHEGSIAIRSFEKLYIDIYVSDPDGHAVSVSYRNGSEADTFTQVPAGHYMLSIVGSAVREGTYTALITATDEYGLASDTEIRYRILGNMPPEKISEIDNVLVTAKGQEFTIDMLKHVTDPDGEQLKYELRISDPKVIHMTARDNEIIGTALGYGITEASVIAMDSKGESVTFTFKVLVRDASDPLSLYPNPVVDNLNISTLEEAETSVRILSSTGRTVYEEVSMVSAFEPACIDMTSCAPGQYQVVVSFGGNEYKRTIVKL